MKAGLIVARVDRIGNAAFDFHAQEIGQNKFFAADFLFFPDGQNRREHGRGRMGQQTVDCFLGS